VPEGDGAPQKRGQQRCLNLAAFHPQHADDSELGNDAANHDAVEEEREELSPALEGRQVHVE